MSNAIAEVAAARRNKIAGFAIVLIASMFIFASVVLNLYVTGRDSGLAFMERLATSIYQATQFPVINIIWDIAAIPNQYELMQLNNLGFLIEFLALLGGVSLIASAQKIQKHHFDAKEKVAQQKREDHYRNQ